MPGSFMTSGISVLPRDRHSLRTWSRALRRLETHVRTVAVLLRDGTLLSDLAFQDRRRIGHQMAQVRGDPVPGNGVSRVGLLLGLEATHGSNGAVLALDEMVGPE